MITRSMTESPQSNGQGSDAVLREVRETPGVSFLVRDMDVSYAVGGRDVLRGVSLEIADGEYVSLVGPNGAGKSTLLQVLAGIIAPNRGTVQLHGQAISSFGRRELARRVAWLPQRISPGFDITVGDFVALGRTPHASAWGGSTVDDETAIARALDETGTTAFRNRLVQELSGGEQQRVALAMALAQAPKVLLLDEPSSHLDPAHALAILDVVARWHRDHGLTVVAVFHDLNLAALAAERVIVLADGQVFADGPPDTALAPEVLSNVFGPVMHTLRHPASGITQVLPARAPGVPPPHPT